MPATRPRVLGQAPPAHSRTRQSLLESLGLPTKTPAADPDALLYRRFHSVEKQWNNDGDPDIDALLDQGKLTVDAAKRKEAYDRAQRLMVEKAIQIWTFAPDIIDVTQSFVHYDQHFTTNYYGFRTVWLDR